MTGPPDFAAAARAVVARLSMLSITNEGQHKTAADIIAAWGRTLYADGVDGAAAEADEGAALLREASRSTTGYNYDERGRDVLSYAGYEMEQLAVKLRQLATRLRAEEDKQ